MKERVIGIMSGTSADGIDAVLLECSDVAVPHEPTVLDRTFLAYPPALQAQLVRPAQLSAAQVARLHFSLAERYAEAARSLSGWQTARCAGLHGQTVVHEVGANAVDNPCTLQLGSSAVLASRLGMPVVGDMRSADVALGGLGAPLVPFAHWFFLSGHKRTAVVVNIGGICNVTLATAQLGGVRGSDVGPGMMLSDAWAHAASHGEHAYDKDGVLSAGGQRIPRLLEQVLAHPFVAAAAPKAAGREQFGEAFAAPLFASVASEKPADVAFTLLEATAHALATALTKAPFVGATVDEVVLTGGGAKHAGLVALCRGLLEQGCSNPSIRVADAGVMAPSNHEPAAMALIALRTLHDLPSSLPAVTGASDAAVLGHVHRPPRAPRVTE